MDESNASSLLYRRYKPQGKVKRRVQDLRFPSSSGYDSKASRPAFDLSHNESARLAADSLLSQGLDGYHEVLKAEGEVDFLSEPEKVYILENGRDRHTGDSGASDDGEELESLYDPQSATSCLAESTDSDLTVTGLGLSSPKDIKRTDSVLDEPNVEVYFQSDSRAAGMKDRIREFIREANMALAIVMDCFSDVELLCDLLEASRRRNVSVHLLLDHLNLNSFISMWHDLKLNSQRFPKLSVRSVDGETYCARTGRKLTGQITENFIISDWTEVLTGSYSFSWLTWQVHRSLAVRVKGSTVKPFHQEFLRLSFRSKPVPSFINCLSVPHATLDALPKPKTNASKSKLNQIKTMCHRAGKEDAPNTQTKAKIALLSDSQTDPDHQTPHRPEKPSQLHPKPPVPPGALQLVSVDHVRPLQKNQTQIQNPSNPPGQTHVSYVQSQLTSLKVTTTADKSMRAQESTSVQTQDQHRVVSYQSADLDVCAEGLFFRQRNRNRPGEPSGTAAGLDTQSRQWRVDFLSDSPKVSAASKSQQKQAKTGLQFPFTLQRGKTAGQPTKLAFLGTRGQAQTLQPHPTTESPGSKSASGLGSRFKPQLQLFLPATLHLQAHNSHQARPLPRLNWMPQSRTERPRPLTRHSSFGNTYGMGQKTDGLEDWRPSRNSRNVLLGRSKSMTDRHLASPNPHT